MQVAVAIGGSYIDTLCHDVHSGARRILLEGVARLDLAFLVLQSFLLAVHLCELRHEVDKLQGGLV